MKAKEWAARFGEGVDVPAEMAAFVAEIPEIAGRRGGTPNAREGAVREQRLKWAAVCRLRPTLTQKFFDDALPAEFRDWELALRKDAEEPEPAGDARPRPARGGYGRRLAQAAKAKK